MPLGPRPRTWEPRDHAGADSLLGGGPGSAGAGGAAAPQEPWGPGKRPLTRHRRRLSGSLSPQHEETNVIGDACAHLAVSV